MGRLCNGSIVWWESNVLITYRDGKRVDIKHIDLKDIKTRTEQEIGLGFEDGTVNPNPVLGNFREKTIVPVPPTFEPITDTPSPAPSNEPLEKKP